MNEKVISALTACCCKEREIIEIFHVNIYLLEGRSLWGVEMYLQLSVPAPMLSGLILRDGQGSYHDALSLCPGIRYRDEENVA